MRIKQTRGLQPTFSLDEATGVRLLCVIVGLQILFSLFFTIGQKSIPATTLAQFTRTGQEFFYPERELPLYGTACLLIPLLCILGVAQWDRRAYKEEIDGATRTFRALTLALTAMLGGSIYLVSAVNRFGVPELSLNQSPQGAVFCLACTAVLIQLQWMAFIRISRITPTEMARWNKPRVTSLVEKIREWRRFLLHPTPVSDQERPASISLLKWGADIVIAFLLFALIFIPDTQRLAGVAYILDRMHHWNFFVMSPALGYASGKALGTDYYAQYGVGWAVVLGTLRPLVPLSYSLVLRIFLLLAGGYFAGFYLLLRWLGIKRLTAMIGTFGGLYCQCFTGIPGDPTSWRYPSATVVRYLFDILIFALLGKFIQTKRIGIWGLITFFVAVAIWFETDTGLYFVVALAMFLLSLSRIEGTRVAAKLFGIGAVVIPLILGIELGIASRGTIGQAAFWKGWLECLTFYPSGMAMLPILPSAAVVLPAFSMIGLYLLCIAGPIVRSWKRSSTTVDAFYIAIGVYGLCTFTQFIGRSHPANMSHCVLPLVLLVTLRLGSLFDRFMAGGRPIARLAIIVSVVIGYLVLCCNNREFLWNPCLLTYIFPGQHRVLFQQIGFTETMVSGRQGTDHALSVDASGRPDIILPPDMTGFALRYDASVKAVKALAQQGKRVAILGNEDTGVDLAAGVPPWGRYSPAVPLLVRWSDVDKLCTQLRSGTDRPDVILLPTPASMQNAWPDTTDTLQRIQTEILKSYKLQSTIGEYDFYQRL